MQNISPLQFFSVQHDGQWQKDDNLRDVLQWFGAQETGAQSANGHSEGELNKDEKAKAVRDILYHVETLRKRPGAED